MRPRHSFVILAGLYLVTQGLGLIVGAGLSQAIEAGDIEPAIQGGETVAGSGRLFAIILVMTAILLVLMKFGVAWIIKFLLYIAILFGLLVTLPRVLGEVVGVTASYAVFVLYLLRKENMWVMNATLALMIPGVGGWLGASLSVGPALVLLVAVSAYDYVSVYGTKHMVTLAKGSKEMKLPLMFAVPVKDRVMGVGTGDMALPLVFTVSVLAGHGLVTAAAASLGGLAGLALVFWYAIQDKGKALPALPPIAAGSVLGFAAGLLL